MELERVLIVSDDDGHEYVIPYVLKDIFYNLLEEDDEDEFEEVFDQYRCGGDPFAEYEFYIKKK